MKTICDKIALIFILDLTTNGSQIERGVTCEIWSLIVYNQMEDETKLRRAPVAQWIEQQPSKL